MSLIPCSVFLVRLNVKLWLYYNYMQFAQKKNHYTKIAPLISLYSDLAHAAEILCLENELRFYAVGNFDGSRIVPVVKCFCAFLAPSSDSIYN